LAKLYTRSNFLSITVEFFLIAVFFRGALLPANSRYLPPPYSFAGGGYRSRPFWGLAGVRFLFYLNLYGNIYMFTFKKKHTSEHVLPDLRPDLEFQLNFGLEQTFKIFKTLQKHIPASGVCQSYSMRGKPLFHTFYLGYLCDLVPYSSTIGVSPRYCSTVGVQP
jgi:hypothetical protein